jgi:hypothetical protein
VIGVEKNKIIQYLKKKNQGFGLSHNTLLADRGI